MILRRCLATRLWMSWDQCARTRSRKILDLHGSTLSKKQLPPDPCAPTRSRKVLVLRVPTTSKRQLLPDPCLLVVFSFSSRVRVFFVLFSTLNSFQNDWRSNIPHNRFTLDSVSKSWRIPLS